MANPDPAPFTIADLMSPAGVQMHLAGRERDAVLAELVDLVPELSDRPDGRAALLKALVDREELHSTAIGDGIALPHARQVLAGLVQRPVVAFGRHLVGVRFGALDHRPTHLFFLLVTTSVTEHLRTLARLSRLLRDANLRQGLLTAPDADAALRLIRRAEAAG